MIEVKVSSANSGQKAEKFVKKYLSEAPLGFIYKAFRKKDIKANGHWVPRDYVLKEGDVVRIYVTDAQLEDFKKPHAAIKREFPYKIAFENDQILVVDKPKGVLVYGDDRGSKETLSNAVLDYLYLKGEFDPNHNTFVPSPAHRLDRNTSGLVCYGKTDAALKELMDLFKERTEIEKRYLTLVVGNVEKDGEVNIALKKDAEKGRVFLSTVEQGGKSACTRYFVKKKYGAYTLLEIELVTGRTHQIRAHMAAIQHPVVGDSKYGDFEDDRAWKKMTGLDSQFLHAADLYFGNLKGVLAPLSGKHIHSDLPELYQKALAIMTK